MKREVKIRLIKHIAFLEKEIEDYVSFKSLSWEEYNKISFSFTCDWFYERRYGKPFCLGKTKKYHFSRISGYKMELYKEIYRGDRTFISEFLRKGQRIS